MFLPRPVLLTAGRRLRGRAPEERRGRLLCLQCPEEVDHLNGALGAVRPLVARLGAGALNGLFDGVGGEDAEEHRYAGLQRRLGDALGHLRAHIVVVAGGAPDHRPQGDDGVI